MPESHEFALFIHIVGVFAAASASVTSIIVLAMMRRANTVQEVRLWSNLGAMAEQAFPFATLVLLLSGGYLVEDLAFSWGDGWVNVSAIALVLMAVAVLKISTLRMNALHHEADEAPDGPVPAALAARIADPVLFGVTHAVMTGLLGIAWNMTTKPGDAEAGIVVLVAIAVGAASAAPMAARQQHAAELGEHR